MFFRVARIGRRCRRGCSPADDGFTLIEMIATMAVAAILMATAAWGLRAYTDAQAEKGTANKVLTSLRDTAQRAQSEGRAYCVSFDSTTSWSVWRYSCTTWTGVSLQGTTINASKMSTTSAQGKALLATASFTTPAVAGFSNGCPAGSLGCAYFFPRGISSDGSVVVTRSGSTRMYTVTLKGLTSRAYLG